MAASPPPALVAEAAALPPPRAPSAALFRRFVAAEALAVAVLLFLPNDSWAHVIWQVAVGWTSAAFVVVGVLRNRPAGAAAWCLFGAGVFMNATGTLVEAIASRVFHYTDYPSVADFFWAGLYPGFIGGMVLLVRRRSSRRDWAPAVETSTITTGLALLAWVLIIRPQAFDPTLTMAGRAAVIVYPVSDLVLLAMMVRLLLGGGRRSVAFRLMLGSLLGFLTSDVGWAIYSHLGRAPDPIAHRLLAMTYAVAYALVGAAALHPSVNEVAEPAPRRQERRPLGLLAGLTIASLIAPALLITQALRHEITDALAIGVGCTVLFLLVVARIAQLLLQVEEQARQLRDLARVDELTGLPNRRAWSSDLPLALERARRDRLPISLAMIDLDNFKRFNDSYGHPAGDKLLQGAAVNWRAHLRVFDQLARYGGEEFVALLPAADGEQALTILERLRAVTPAGQTFSAGVAIWNGVETGDELLVRADRALYQAKASGRNRCLVAVEPGAAEPPARATSD
jgi:diguanylate cyclase (GGDEF)-like protein